MQTNKKNIFFKQKKQTERQTSSETKANYTFVSIHSLIQTITPREHQHTNNKLNQTNKQIKNEQTIMHIRMFLLLSSAFH
jgi:hypothetical protein